MKKSLVIMVVLVGSLALVGSVFAGGMAKRHAVQAAGCGDCYSAPSCQPAPCKDQVLCKGKAKGVEKMCGPCAPTIKWAGSWMTVLKCPASAAPAKAMAKKGKHAVKKSKKK
ncbi:MAG: hypothetical protein M1511_08975 [Deltaproteobacteria bacterium]|nr:hypothetical protein [Deltaproteobacteria bacterium]